MNRDCMLWINMPHQIGISVMVIGVTISAMYMNDNSWADWDSEQCKEPISCPYYCMCKRWDGTEWKTLEDGKKPYEILLQSDPSDLTEAKRSKWISRDRPAITHQNHFGKDNQFTVFTEQATGWTFEEWTNRVRYEQFFQTDDPPAWPLSTISTMERLHVSRGVRLVPGSIAVDEAPKNVTLRAD